MTATGTEGDLAAQSLAAQSLVERGFAERGRALGEAVATANDATVAHALAEAAGEVLLELRDQLGFEDPKALRTAGDLNANALLMAALQVARPLDGLLSEEGKSSTAAEQRRLTSTRTWIIDPLDGTREFGEEGRSDWAVHVALWGAGPDDVPGTAHRLLDGAVAMPAARRTLSSADLLAAAPAVRPADDGPITAVVSRSRPPAFLTELALVVALEFVPMGSAGAKVMAVVTGQVDAYLHAGGQYEWDSAAPAAVALAAGYHASRLDGSPLIYNRPDPLLPDLLVCRPALAGRLLEAVAGIHR